MRVCHAERSEGSDWTTSKITKKTRISRMPTLLADYHVHRSNLYYILPSFLTFRLLSVVVFLIFLSVLFEAAKSTKNARHRAFYSFAPFAHKLLCNILRPSQTLRSCLNVPISGMEQLASRTTGNVWHTRSNNLHSLPLLELTLTVSLTVPEFIWKLPLLADLSSYILSNAKNLLKSIAEVLSKKGRHR